MTKKKPIRCLWREGGPANELCQFPVVTTLQLGPYFSPVCKRHEPTARERKWHNVRGNEDLLQ